MHFVDCRRFVGEFAWVSLLIVVAYCDISVRTVEFSKTSSKSVDENHAIRNLQQVKSVTRCVAHCIREAKCLSVIYKHQDGECELYDTLAEDVNGEDTQHRGWRYYSLDSSSLETKMAATTVPKITATTPDSTTGPTTPGRTTLGPTTPGRTTLGPTTPKPTTVPMTTGKRGPKDCYEHFEEGRTDSGKYTIYVAGLSSGLEVYCDMFYDNGGWTRFQRRITGSQRFHDRTWAEYQSGFGDAIGDDDSEFWIGLDNLHLLTNQDDYQIRIPMVDYDGDLIYAQYDHFKISDESDNYRLDVSGYVGLSNAGDALTDSHNGMPWSTIDRDNDNDTKNCAEVMRGAWWYGRCLTYNSEQPYSSNLNGPWVSYPGYLRSDENGITWDSWKHESVKKAQMKIKPYLAK